MTEAYILTLAQSTLMVVLKVAGPLLGLSLILGLVISILQAITSIQDVTLAFVPKIIAVFVAIVIFGPWMLRVVVTYTYGLLVNLPYLAR